jgi:chromosome segregation ATPase
MLPLCLAVATAALGWRPLMAGPMRCSSVHAARCRPVLASEKMDLLPEDDRPREDNQTLSVGDVLAELARRQLAELDPIEVAEAELGMLVDDCLIDMTKILHDLNREIEKVQRFATDAQYAQVEALENELLQQLYASATNLETRTAAMRQKIRRAREERGRLAAEDVERADRNEEEDRKKLAELREEAMAQKRARAQARADAAKARSLLNWYERSAPALWATALLALAALPLVELPLVLE